MAFDEFFLKGLQSGAELAMKKWMAKQKKESQTTKNEIDIASAGLIPSETGTFDIGGKKYGRAPMQTPDFSGMGGGTPVDLKITMDDSGKTSYNWSPNPKLSSEEVRGLAAAPQIHKLTQDIIDNVKESKLGENFTVQTIYDFGRPFLAGKGTPLHKALTARNSLEKFVLFDEAGKALTGPEKGIMLQMFDSRGKDEATIVKDLKIMDEIATMKEKLIREGKGALYPQVVKNYLKDKIVGGSSTISADEILEGLGK